ncbi:hypothetical protein [Amycolatopsis jiangsuensis]|uniref:Uncharacterized protein n=1 Tax=Amycolatopsis jiangsuensis TaxID=1181879 RepID=A0A840J3Y0_9PSEU|nr:hypothetical protein [Amycolatopsis jiangsuensis]MBB4689796.1 hypothetical protein [Amycolatopsis jiangsuensis]
MTAAMKRARVVLSGAHCWRPVRLAEVVGFGGIVAVTVAAAVLGLVGCKPVEGAPSPRAPYSEDAGKPDYRCGYDGNRRCPADGSVNR